MPKKLFRIRLEDNAEGYLVTDLTHRSYYNLDGVIYAQQQTGWRPVSSLGDVDTVEDFERLTGSRPQVFVQDCLVCGRPALLFVDEDNGVCVDCQGTAIAELLLELKQLEEEFPQPNQGPDQVLVDEIDTECSEDKAEAALEVAVNCYRDEGGHPVVCISFKGAAGVGSSGNHHGQQMRSVVRQAIESEAPAGLVIDLTGLEYRMGNWIANWVQPGMPLGRTAVVASGETLKRLGGLWCLTKLDNVCPIFEQREDALAFAYGGTNHGPII
jgi:hypothetical protein